MGIVSSIKAALGGGRGSERRGQAKPLPKSGQYYNYKFQHGKKKYNNKSLLRNMG